MRVISIQPSPVVDHITEDGTELTRLPYPFHIDVEGNVQRQDFWQGTPQVIIGFQADAARQQIDLWWADVVKDPQKAVRMYPVFRDGRSKGGGMWTNTIAIETVTETEL